MIESRSNWAGNLAYHAARLHYPETIEQVRELVARADRVKALGSRHSFGDVADTAGEHISLERFRHAVAVDRERRVATVDGGITYGQLAERLHREGYALRNMASLPHISVAGAVATATHGSGDRHGVLATAVRALQLVAADGSVVALDRDRDGDRFRGAVVGLGGLGVVTRLWLDVEPAYEVRQDVYEGLAPARLGDRFEEIASLAYSVSVFTDWRGAAATQIWLKSRIGDGAAGPPPELFGATPAPAPRHPIRALSAAACTEQMGVPGPWHERLPHFRAGHTPSSGDELQTEYMVPRRHAAAAFRAMARLAGRMAPVLQISEVRTVAADDLWMSPCYRGACVAIHFTWAKDREAVRRLLPTIEAELAPLDARPHWGKLFATPPERIRSLYPRLGDFRDLLRSLDPEGKFRNAFLDTYVFGAA